MMPKFKKRVSHHREVNLHNLELVEASFQFDKERLKIKGKAYYGEKGFEYDYVTHTIPLDDLDLENIPGEALNHWAYRKLHDHITID